MAAGRHPAVNLVAIAGAMIIIALKLTGTSYETYFAGAQFIHFLLGPATVALAVPLYRHFEQVKKNALPILVSLAAGSVAAIFSVTLIAREMGASKQMIASLAPKSVTSPIAMGLSEQLGGMPFFTAALVIVTGVLGALMLTPLMRLLRIRDPAAIGMAAGVAVPRHRHRPRLPYRFGRGRLRRNRHGPERRLHQPDSAAAQALASDCDLTSGAGCARRTKKAKNS